MNRQDYFFNRLAREGACLVSVHATRGSVPRGQGAWMAVFAGAVVGTIGGGQLEFQSIDEARRRLRGSADPAVALPLAEVSGSNVLPNTSPSIVRPVIRYSLGPSLGQCCGGEVHLLYELVSAHDVASLTQRLRRALPPVALFGGGHVGKALVQVLGSLPVQVTWIDSRDEIFPSTVPDNATCEHSDPVHAAVAQLAPGSQVVIMSFSHAEDLDVVAACLARQRVHGDLSCVGLIGSKTKWATFRHRLAARGFSAAELDGVTCPIGIPGITGKEPEVIALSVAAQILRGINPLSDQNST